MAIFEEMWSLSLRLCGKPLNGCSGVYVIIRLYQQEKRNLLSPWINHPDKSDWTTKYDVNDNINFCNAYSARAYMDTVKFCLKENQKSTLQNTNLLKSLLDRWLWWMF